MDKVACSQQTRNQGGGESKFFSHRESANTFFSCYVQQQLQ